MEPLTNEQLNELFAADPDLHQLTDNELEAWFHEAQEREHAARLAWWAEFQEDLLRP